MGSNSLKTVLYCALSGLCYPEISSRRAHTRHPPLFVLWKKQNGPHIAQGGLFRRCDPLYENIQISPAVYYCQSRPTEPERQPWLLVNIKGKKTCRIKYPSLGKYCFIAGCRSNINQAKSMVLHPFKEHRLQSSRVANPRTMTRHGNHVVTLR